MGTKELGREVWTGSILIHIVQLGTRVNPAMYVYVRVSYKAGQFLAS
jgi:hypothetical protein